MMPSEAGALLTIASGFDRRKVDAGTMSAWAEALDGYSTEQVRAVIMKHFTDPDTRHKYLSIGDVLDRLEEVDRSQSREVADDVRAAKARRLIGSDWPGRQRLPADVAAKLRELREAERSELKALGGAE